MDEKGNELRRRIGYVIKKKGIFKNRKVGENIEKVKEIIGWKKKRIEERVDEMMEMLKIEKGEYRERYKKEI